MTDELLKNLSRDDKFRLACAMVRNPNTHLDDAVAQLYADRVCPQEGCSRNPKGKCVLCLQEDAPPV